MTVYLDHSPTTYLDHNATTPVRPEVVDAMLPWLREGYGNPNSVYSLGQRARAAVERAREQVAALLGAADSSEIVFTSGGSESDVLAIAGGAWQAHDETKGKRRKVVTSKIEHDAVRLLAGQLRRRGLDVLEAGCGADGVVDAAGMKAMLDDATAVFSLMHANNETGALQPVAELAASARAAGALVHTDAVQSLGKIGIDAKALGVDLLAVSGHKVNAPKGVGALYVRRGVRLAPLVTGHQEKNRRGGTENTASIVGFGVACELAARELSAAASHALALRRRIEAGALLIKGARLNGPHELRLPNTVHLSFDGIDGHHLVVALDLEGICVSSGPACSSGASTPSHVLTAMGVPPEVATGSIRVSVGWGSTDADADRLLAALPKAVEKLRAVGAPA
ncbi:MAG: aminotransferase class V-fold PLP-dependent enzyme [Elusimicrobia bacterium]|nr:aminotransferase class V-fold PLP-dependent enzyme [Elusimicrobiota bacterium]